jgi:hypothetical protein
MSRVLVYWQRAHWMNGAEVGKSIKKYLQTAQSYGVDLEVVDGDGSIDGSGLQVSALVSKCCTLDKQRLHVILEPLSSFPADKQSLVTDLRDFVHPADCTYVIWSEHGTTPFEDFGDYQAVCIPSVPNTSPLWSHVALGILLYDRWVKLQ